MKVACPVWTGGKVVRPYLSVHGDAATLPDCAEHPRQFLQLGLRYFMMDAHCRWLLVLVLLLLLRCPPDKDLIYVFVEAFVPLGHRVLITLQGVWTRRPLNHEVVRPAYLLTAEARWPCQLPRV